MKPVIDTDKLELWLNNGLNVLMIGNPGVGKTAGIKSVFEKMALNYKYYSASTMEPYVDFVGVPRVVTGENGEEFLKLVRQKGLSEVEALFFDEYNRAPKKIRNAVMELIQFRSINGIPFPNLKVVWAAINPQDENDSMDIEPMDPAQLDRFDVKYHIDYRPCPVYFTETFGSDLADKSINWWNTLSDTDKAALSPRRLAGALQWHLKGGDVKDIIDGTINVSKFIDKLNSTPINVALEDLFTSQNAGKILAWINQENNLLEAKDIIIGNDNYMTAFLPHLNSERLATMLLDESVCAFVVSKVNEIPSFGSITTSIINSNTNAEVCKNIKTYALKNWEKIKGTELLKAIEYDIVENPHAAFYNSTTTYSYTYLDHLTALRVKSDGYDCKTNVEKAACWKYFINYVPKNMNDEEGWETCKFLEGISKKPAKSTVELSNLEKFPDVVNTVMKSLIRNGHLLEDVWDKLSFTRTLLMGNSELYFKAAW